MTFSACRFAFASLLVAGCQGGAATEVRRIVPHGVADCDVEGSDVVLTALGDFSATRAAASVPLKASQDTPLPFDLRGIEASTLPPGLRGVGYAEPPNDVHLTMWSTSSACRAAEEDVVPPSQGGQAMTAFDGGGAVIVAGLEPGAGGVISNAAFALAWDTRTGAKLPRPTLAHRVSWATATSFGGGALIAGGFDRGFFPLRYLDSAMVFPDGALGDPPVTIPIGDARAEHGAVVVASGATLLVGGEDERGVIDTLVSITPTATPPYGVADFFMLGSLARARKRPTVLRLSNDEIFVAGGVDGSGNDVPTLEWFAKNGGRCPHAPCTAEPPELAGLADVAFVALPGGGVLAVGGFAASTGAPASGVFWIDDAGDDVGAVERLPPLTVLQRGTKRLRLVGAGDGAPWLWNGESWLRFDPWQNVFATPDAAPEDGPDDDFPPPLAIDPGLFVWLSRAGGDPELKNASLRGFRHGVRGPYTHDPDFLFADPRHVAPSRPPHVDGELWTDADGLHLSESASIVVTDTTYGDVVISGETPGSSLPVLELGAWSIGPPGPCPWPAAGTKFTVTRTAGTLLVAVDDAAPQSCPGPQGRVTVGLRGLGAERVTIKRLSVARR